MEETCDPATSAAPFIVIILFLWLFAHENLAQAKFNPENMARYIDFLFLIATIVPERVKYFDEAHFVSSSLYRKKALGPIGKRIFVINNMMQGNLRFTLSLATTISVDWPCTTFASVTTEANTAVNFAHTVMKMLTEGFLQRGDVLVILARIQRMRACVQFGEVSTSVQTHIRTTIRSNFEFSELYQ
jgi:hypothetical protein